MRFYESEEAVSPVIGVILMVAITVILAAVIAVFVFGMAGDVEGTKSLGATAKQVDTNIIVTYHGGPDHDGLDYLNTTVYNDDGTVTASWGTTANPMNDADPQVGDTYTFVGAGDSNQQRVVVVATFDDGYSQVIADQSV